MMDGYEQRHPERHGLLLILVILALSSPAVASSAGKNDAITERIGLSALALEEATVTVSVLDDPLRPIHTLLELCGSVAEHPADQEDREITDHIRRLCRTIEQVTRAMEPPVQALRPDGYLVTIPLREPLDGMRAVTWRSATLDEAMVFLDLLGGEKLRGVTVHRRVPSSASDPPACVECPIKDLVFSAASIKEDPRFLK